MHFKDELGGSFNATEFYADIEGHPDQPQVRRALDENTAALPSATVDRLAVATALPVAFLAFSGLGILSASYVLLFKRGNPAKWLLLSFSNVAGGMLFPTSILPDWLQFAARLNPVTYALDGMRAALLSGANLAVVWRSVAVLFLMAALLLPASIVVFSWTLRRTKTTGTLTHS